MRSTSLTGTCALVFVCVLGAAPGESVRTVHVEAGIIRPVAGTGVHYLTTAIIHSAQPTDTGMIQTSTETVDLVGDLTGRILYHPTTVFDFAAGTLVNTGHQVFSGTVLGSAPVMLHDDEFRFDGNLTTGAVTGKVYLTDKIAGSKIRCELEVIGTGMTPEGNVTASYTGFCRF